MSLSLNPVDVLKIFLDRGVSSKAEVVEYVQAIANDAALLCEQWTKFYEESGTPLKRGELNQRQIFKRLSFQYSTASSVLRGRVPEERLKELFDSLGGLLMTRNELKGAFEGETPWTFPDDSELIRRLESLNELAGTLSGIATAIKASH